MAPQTADVAERGLAVDFGEVDAVARRVAQHKRPFAKQVDVDDLDVRLVRRHIVAVGERGAHPSITLRIVDRLDSYARFGGLVRDRE